MDELRPSDEALPPRSSSEGGTGRGYERVPPHSLEAEASVLGACLLSQRAATDVSAILGSDDFYRSAHGTLFEGILALRAQGTGIDSITLTEWLRDNNRLGEVGGAAAVHELAQSVPTAANAEYYARIVRDKAMLRRLIDVAGHMAQLGFEPTDDVQAVIDHAESLVFKLNEQGTVNDYAELKELLDEAYLAIEQRADRDDDVTGLRTGFADLDKLTAGLQPSNLIIVAARPAMGKSSLALSIARFVSVDQKKPSILFSLEMSRREIVERLLSAQARIDSTRIRVGRLDQSDWTKLADALGDMSDAPLFIDDTPSITMMEIQSKCRQLKHKRGLELVIVDYLQLMQSHRSVDNRQQEVAEISRGLKRLAMDLEVPVVALSQLSRQPEGRTDKRPVLSDLRESGCLTASMRLTRADTGEQLAIGEMAARELRNIPVVSTDTDGRLVHGRVTKSFPSGVKEVFSVTLRSGAVIEASDNHPFRTLHGWTPLEQLHVGSRVATARRMPEPTSADPMDPDELVLLAHLIGEGTIVDRQPTHYTSADEANLEAVEKAAYNLFGITAKRRADGRSAVTTQLYLPAPFATGRGRRGPIREWLEGFGLFDHRSWQKFVPTRVFETPDDQVSLFLRHLFATDGCAEIEGGRFSTSSERLAQDVRLLLLRVGFHASIRQTSSRDAGGRQQCRVDVEPKDRAAATNDLFWDEISAIEPLGPQPVYDVTIAEHHNFVAEGIVLHNSIEQDADVVAFIYRDEVYHEDSEAQGLAELIVAKHRNGPVRTVHLAFLNHLTQFANLARGATPPSRRPTAPSGDGPRPGSPV